MWTDVLPGDLQVITPLAPPGVQGVRVGVLAVADPSEGAWVVYED